MKTTDIVLDNALLFDRRDDGSWTATPGALAIADGRIAARAECGTLTGAGTLDLHGALAMPGLINGHTHSAEILMAGGAGPATLYAWHASVWPLLDRLPDALIHAAVLAQCAELLHAGCTGVVDHFRQTPFSVAAAKAGLSAYAETGMRAAVSLVVRDAANPDGSLVGAPHVRKPAEYPLDAALRVIDDWPDHALARPGLGPSAPERCSDAMLRRIAALAEERNLAIHLHVDETRHSFEAGRGRAASPTARLADLGLLSPRTSFAHCVWTTDDDLRLIREAGTTVVHNPVCNMILGSGRAPVPRMLELGVPVALGCDGAASNDGQDIWETAKVAAILHRGPDIPEARWPTPARILDMLCATGWRLLDLHHPPPAGPILAPGRPADIAVFDAAAVVPVARRDAATQLVLRSGPRAARHVLVAGRFVVRDGVIATFDETEARRACLDGAARLGA